MPRLIVAALGAAVLLATPAFAAETTIVDHAGRKVTFEAPVKNVAVFCLPLAETFIAVDGGPERLGGINPLAQEVIMKSVLGQIFPEVAKINSSVVSRDFVPNVESLLAAKPDVVVQWAEREEDLVEPIERVGIPVVTLKWGDHEVERDQIRILGKILGKEDRAQEFLDYETKVVTDIAAKLDQTPVEERPTMVFIDTWEGNRFNVFRNNEYYFQASGLRNVVFEAGGGDTIGIEQLLAWDPDIIFLNYYDLNATTDAIIRNPALQALSAVRNGRVYKTPFLDPAGQAAPLVDMWFANLGMPKLFNYDVRQAIKDRYQVMYNAGLTEQQVDSLLQMDVNGDRAGYRETFAARN